MLVKGGESLAGSRLRDLACDMELLKRDEAWSG